MGQVTLLGAGGVTGRLVAAELVRRGHEVDAVGRDPARVERALAEVGQGPGRITATRRADVTDPAALDAALPDGGFVLTTVGPYERLGRPVVDAAVRRGCGYLDIAGEAPFLRWLHGRDEEVRGHGVSVLPGAGLEFGVGDLLADVAARSLEAPVEAVHVTYAVRSPGVVPALSPGSRRSLAGLLGQRGPALVDGEVVEELPGEARRLAWFPRPLGPSHAAGVPGAEPVTVPRHVPGVATVRTYLAVPGWQAELLQLGAAAVRWAPIRRVATAVLTRGGTGREDRRAATRWACVAEAAGGDEVGRAWAAGTDLYGTAAVVAVALAEVVLEERAPRGVVPPALVDRAEDVLDRIAARSNLLWAVTHGERADR